MHESDCQPDNETSRDREKRAGAHRSDAKAGRNADDRQQKGDDCQYRIKADWQVRLVAEHGDEMGAPYSRARHHGGENEPRFAFELY